MDGQARTTTQGCNNTIEYWSVDDRGIMEHLFMQQFTALGNDWISLERRTGVAK